MHRNVAWSFAVLMTLVLATTASATTIVYDISPFALLEDGSHPLSLVSGTITAKVNLATETVTSITSVSAVLVYNNDTDNPITLTEFTYSQSDLTDYHISGSADRLWMEVPTSNCLALLTLMDAGDQNDVVWSARRYGETETEMLRAMFTVYGESTEELPNNEPIEIGTSNGLPEPTSLALLGIGATALLRRRRRA